MDLLISQVSLSWPFRLFDVILTDDAGQIVVVGKTMGVCGIWTLTTTRKRQFRFRTDFTQIFCADFTRKGIEV